MTAKEKLREVVDGMSEDEATRWLGQMAPEECDNSFHKLIRDAIRRSEAIPDEVWARMPQSSEIDRVVYGGGRTE
jgi:hypothetical protein